MIRCDQNISPVYHSDQIWTAALNSLSSFILYFFILKYFNESWNTHIQCSMPHIEQLFSAYSVISFLQLEKS